MGVAIKVPGIDFSFLGLGTVTVTQNENTPTDVVQVTQLNIIGEQIINANNSSYRVSYTPSNTTQIGVKWSIISGSEYASINENTGVLTINKDVKQKSVTIKATSIHNSLIYKTFDIVVSNTESTPTEIQPIFTCEGVAGTNEGSKKIKNATGRDLGIKDIPVFTAIICFDNNAALQTAEAEFYNGNAAANIFPQFALQNVNNANGNTVRFRVQTSNSNSKSWIISDNVFVLKCDGTYLYHYTNGNWINLTDYPINDDNSEFKFFSYGYQGKYKAIFYDTDQISDNKINEIINNWTI